MTIKLGVENTRLTQVGGDGEGDRRATEGTILTHYDECQGRDFTLR